MQSVFFYIAIVVGTLAAAAMVTMGLLAMKRSWIAIRSHAATPEGQAKTKALLESGFGNQLLSTVTTNPNNKSESFFMLGLASALMGIVLFFSIFGKLFA